ncbi:MAG: DUF1761 family protein [Planctomycetes bacterium]|nr:DUF1761 family protein [Planctomycetota bacterium]
MTLAFSSVAWLHVLVAALAAFFLGAFWYTVFGKARQRAFGITDADLQRLQRLRPPALFLGGMLASYLVLAFGCELLLRSLAITGAGSGALFGGLLWLGVAVPIGVTAWIATAHRLSAFAIDFAFQGVFLPMTGAILGGWQ